MRLSSRCGCRPRPDEKLRHEGTAIAAPSPVASRTPSPSGRRECQRTPTAATSENSRSAPARASGSSPDGTACRQNCRGRRSPSPARRSRRRDEVVRARAARRGTSARNRRRARPRQSGCRRAADARARHVERVPAHMRNLERRIGWLDLDRVAGDPAEPVARHLLQPALGHQLAADADAEERLAAARSPPRSAPPPCRGRRRARAGNRRRRRRPAARCAPPLATASASEVTTIRVAGLARRALERLGGGVEIAGAVIDDGDGHRASPLRLREEPEDRLVGTLRRGARACRRRARSRRSCRAAASLRRTASRRTAPPPRRGPCRSSTRPRPSRGLRATAGGCCSPRARRAGCREWRRTAPRPRRQAGRSRRRPARRRCTRRASATAGARESRGGTKKAGQEKPSLTKTKRSGRVGLVRRRVHGVVSHRENPSRSACPWWRERPRRCADRWRRRCETPAPPP